MATYAELRSAAENDALLIKVQVACIVAANTVATEADTVPLHAQRLQWAAMTFADPITASKRMINSVLAKNAAATLAQIVGASDATVQANVDASVNVFAATMG